MLRPQIFTELSIHAQFVRRLDRVAADLPRDRSNRNQGS
jgi:hypothetical protein